MLHFIQNFALFAFQQAADAAEAPAEAAPSQPMGPLYLMVGMTMMLFWFLIIAPERKRAAQKKKLIDNLKKNDRVLTIGGIYGIVSNVKPGEDEIVIKIDDDKDVKVRVSKSSIAQVLGTKEENS